MNEYTISQIKELLYKTDSKEVENILSGMDNNEELYVYAYNYNWDNGFEIPQVILENENCDLSIALLIFYRAEGLNYLEDKKDNTSLPQWSSFIKKLYSSILNGKYKVGNIEFNVPLSKVQLYKIKKNISEEELIFLRKIEGTSLDIDI